MRTALSIAGSDSSGGAGIQADMKTMIMNGVYAMTAITALTAQNTTGVSAIMEVTPEFLSQQIDSVFEDIRPRCSKNWYGIFSCISGSDCRTATFYKAENVVVDPVMVATSGSVLSKDSAVSVMKEKLLPMATVITPNIPESEILTGRKITTKEEMEEAAREMASAYGCAVLCKGGHSINDANDLLCADDKVIWFSGKRIDNPNTHGTGCTLSSAIASNLAKGYSLEQSIERARHIFPALFQVCLI